MKKVTKLTETDLNRIVKRVIKEGLNYTQQNPENPLMGCIKKNIGLQADLKKYPACEKVVQGQVQFIYKCFGEITNLNGFEVAGKISECYKSYSRVKF